METASWNNDDKKPDITVEHVEQAEDVSKAHVDSQAKDYLDASIVITPELNTSLRRKIHKRILPFLCIAYFCQGLDKGTLGAASIMGWIEHVNAKGQDYALTSTILWIGILTGEPLANQVVRRFPLSKVLGGGIFVWSALVFGLAFSLSVPPALAIRYLLGFTESLVGPVIVAIMIQWYTVEEQMFVTTVWQAALGVANMVSSLLAYGFYHIQNSHLHSWQWLHVAIGLVSLIISTVVLVFLPDSPTKARWATEEEKKQFVERIRVNNQGLQNKVWKSEQAKEAFTDPLTYCLFSLTFFNTLIVGGVNTFAPLLIVKAFEFSVLQAQLLNLPLGFIAIVMYLLIGWVAKKTRETCLTMIGFALPNIAGTITLITVKSTPKTKGGLVVAFYFMQIFAACYPMLLTLLSRNVAGQTKRSIVYAIFFIGWAVGNAIAAQIFQAKWAPRYVNSLYIHLGLYVCYIINCLVTRHLLKSRNKKTAAVGVAEDEPHDGTANLHAFEDLSDRQNPDFKYSY